MRPDGLPVADHPTQSLRSFAPGRLREAAHDQANWRLLRGRRRMSHFDSAGAAVEAALAAGARYADARVMHRRYESMTALNGEIEELSPDEDAGPGVRALGGAGWGFFAVPDLDPAAVRRAGERAAAIAVASASVAVPCAYLV